MEWLYRRDGGSVCGMPSSAASWPFSTLAFWWSADKAADERSLALLAATTGPAPPLLVATEMLLRAWLLVGGTLCVRVRRLAGPWLNAGGGGWEGSTGSSWPWSWVESVPRRPPLSDSVAELNSPRLLSSGEEEAVAAVMPVDRRRLRSVPSFSSPNKPVGGRSARGDGARGRLLTPAVRSEATSPLVFPFRSRFLRRWRLELRLIGIRLLGRDLWTKYITY